MSETYVVDLSRNEVAKRKWIVRALKERLKRGFSN